MATDIERVRLHAGDPDPPPATADFTTAYFTDTEIQVFLDEASSDVYLASAFALEAMAASAAQQAITKSTSGQITDSRVAVPTKLLDMAKHYRALSAATPYSAEVEAAVYPWTSNASLEA